LPGTGRNRRGAGGYSPARITWNDRREIPINPPIEKSAKPVVIEKSKPGLKADPVRWEEVKRFGAE